MSEGPRFCIKPTADARVQSPGKDSFVLFKDLRCKVAHGGWYSILVREGHSTHHQGVANEEPGGVVLKRTCPIFNGLVIAGTFA